jgi:hypothetical protein
MRTCARCLMPLPECVCSDDEDTDDTPEPDAA